MLCQNSSGKKKKKSLVVRIIIYFSKAFISLSLEAVLEKRPINVSLPCKREAVKLVVSRLDYS